jgi:5-methylthioadenosine/S-adenosylhomocysteine deaminase
MATITGAKALNKEKEIGSIEEGKLADIIVVDFDSPHLILNNRIVPKLVYSANSRDVKTTIVNGKVLMDNFKVENIDTAEVMREVKVAQKELLDLAGPETHRLINAEWPSNGTYWKL